MPPYFIFFVTFCYYFPLFHCLHIVFCISDCHFLRPYSSLPFTLFLRWLSPERNISLTLLLSHYAIIAFHAIFAAFPARLFSSFRDYLLAIHYSTAFVHFYSQRRLFIIFAFIFFHISLLHSFHFAFMLLRYALFAAICCWLPVLHFHAILLIYAIFIAHISQIISFLSLFHYHPLFPLLRHIISLLHIFAFSLHWGTPFFIFLLFAYIISSFHFFHYWYSFSSSLFTLFSISLISYYSLIFRLLLFSHYHRQIFFFFFFIIFISLRLFSPCLSFQFAYSLFFSLFHYFLHSSLISSWFSSSLFSSLISFHHYYFLILFFSHFPFHSFFLHYYSSFSHSFLHYNILSLLTLASIFHSLTYFIFHFPHCLPLHSFIFITFSPFIIFFFFFFSHITSSPLLYFDIFISLSCPTYDVILRHYCHTDIIFISLLFHFQRHYFISCRSRCYFTPFDFFHYYSLLLPFHAAISFHLHFAIFSFHFHYIFALIF